MSPNMYYHLIWITNKLIILNLNIMPGTSKDKKKKSEDSKSKKSDKSKSKEKSPSKSASKSPSKAPVKD